MQEFGTNAFVSNGDFSLQTRDVFSVLWALLRGCNYSCTYCSFSNQTPLGGPTSSPEDLLAAARTLVALNRPGYQITLYGGEPTFHPGFMPLLEYLGTSEAPIMLRMFTNGSKPRSFFETMATARRSLPFRVIFSLHLEHVAPRNFENYKRAIEVSVEGGIWAGVSLMFLPNWRERARLYAEELLALRERVPFFFRVSFPYDLGGVIGVGCTDADRAWCKDIEAAFDRFVMPAGPQSPFTMPRVVSNITVEQGGERAALPARESLHLLEQAAMPAYRGFYCCMGTNVIFLSEDGKVRGGVCDVGEPLGNAFFDSAATLAARMRVTRCTAATCNSIENIPLPKYKDKAEADATMAAYKERTQAYLMLGPFGKAGAGSEAGVPAAAGMSLGVPLAARRYKGAILDCVGEERVSGLPPRPIPVPRLPTILVSGWAVDLERKGLAAGVDVAIDGAPYAARYGLDRPDVAEHLRNPAYRKAGFTVAIPADRLAPGSHSLTVRVIGQGRDVYRESLATTIVAS